MLLPLRNTSATERAGATGSLRCGRRKIGRVVCSPDLDRSLVRQIWLLPLPRLPQRQSLTLERWAQACTSNAVNRELSKRHSLVRDGSQEIDRAPHRWGIEAPDITPESSVPASASNH